MDTVHWFDASCSLIPLNNYYITSTLSTVPSWATFFAADSMRGSAIFRTVFAESQNASPLDDELEPDFNAK